ncbi:MAG: DMT family transporter [Pseudomonadota bacterium]
MFNALLPITLCLVSAITVAAVNLFVKKGGDVLSTRMLVSLTMAATAVPFAPFVPLPTPAVWAALGISLCAHAGYQFAMVRALHRGDLSLVFPVMRGFAPLAAAILATIFLGEALAPLGWFGLLLASAALLVFALPEDQSIDAANVRRSALFWAVMTSIGIGAYSVADANGTRTADFVPTFIVWLFMLDWIGITLTMAVTRGRSMWRDVRPQLRDGIIAGILGSVSYATALWAFTMIEAAAVTALRETSVVFGAFFGAVLLKEPFGRRRIISAAVLATGLVLLNLT